MRRYSYLLSIRIDRAVKAVGSAEDQSKIQELTEKFKTMKEYFDRALNVEMFKKAKETFEKTKEAIDKAKDIGNYILHSQMHET